MIESTPMDCKCTEEHECEFHFWRRIWLEAKIECARMQNKRIQFYEDYEPTLAEVNRAKMIRREGNRAWREDLRHKPHQPHMPVKASKKGRNMSRS